MTTTDVDLRTAPMYLVLAALGKRVLRPGGARATDALLDRLAISSDDDVVELAPGAGATATRIAARHPRSYVGVDRDASLARRAAAAIARVPGRAVLAPADATTLPTASASVVLGEAMLSMQVTAQKQAIMTEAARLLRPGGRYGIHELAYRGDDPERLAAIERDFSRVVRVGTRICPVDEWTSLLTGAGFTIDWVDVGEWLLLSPTGIVHDEGLGNALRFGGRVATNRVARDRVRALRDVVRRHADDVGVIVAVAHVPA